MPFVPTRTGSTRTSAGSTWPSPGSSSSGTSNAVNLTDGLDGLAIGPTIVAATTFAILCYVAGTTLHIADVVEVGGRQQLVGMPLWQLPGHPARCRAAPSWRSSAPPSSGAGIAFLWFNTYPASVFMGDVGSLALGGALGALAVLTKNEVVSAIIHGVFLAEILSVMIQVVSFKMTGKRVFKMAPIHHHFELKGLAEPKIIVRFWIVSILCGARGAAVAQAALTMAMRRAFGGRVVVVLGSAQERAGRGAAAAARAARG